MTTTPNEPVRDDDIESVGGGSVTGPDADTVDADTDTIDADGTDVESDTVDADSDATDA